MKMSTLSTTKPRPQLTVSEIYILHARLGHRLWQALSGVSMTGHFHLATTNTDSMSLHVYQVLIVVRDSKLICDGCWPYLGEQQRLGATAHQSQLSLPTNRYGSPRHVDSEKVAAVSSLLHNRNPLQSYMAIVSRCTYLSLCLSDTALKIGRALDLVWFSIPPDCPTVDLPKNLYHLTWDIDYHQVLRYLVF